jgi:hypothetical protein
MPKTIQAMQLGCGYQDLKDVPVLLMRVQRRHLARDSLMKSCLEVLSEEHNDFIVLLSLGFLRLLVKLN